MRFSDFPISYVGFSKIVQERVLPLIFNFQIDLMFLASEKTFHIISALFKRVMTLLFFLPAVVVGAHLVFIEHA